jgi:hypothetical protein
LTSTGAIEPPGLAWLDTARSSVAVALTALAGGSPALDMDARFGVDVVTAMDAIERSAVTGRLI